MACKSILNTVWKRESLTSEEAESFVKAVKRTELYPFTKQFVKDLGGLEPPTAQNFVKTLQRIGLYPFIKQEVQRLRSSVDRPTQRVEDGSSSSRWYLSCFRVEDAIARDSCSRHGVQSSVRGCTRRTSLRGSRYKDDGTISDGGESLLDGSTRVMISDGGPDPSAKARGKAIIMEDDGVNVKPTSQTRAVSARPPFVFTVEENLDVALDKYGEILSFDLQGSLSLVILNEEDGCVGVQAETGDNPEIRYETHPDFNGELFCSQNLLGFLAGPSCHEDGTLLRWRLQSADECMVPLALFLWTKVSGNKSRVSITYDASGFFDLTNVIISIPVPPPLRLLMTVSHCSGSYEFLDSVLQWKLPLINDSNRRGLMEFTVPSFESTEVFFPISSQFATTTTFSGVKVTRVFTERGSRDDGFVQTTHLITQNYQVV